MCTCTCNNSPGQENTNMLLLAGIVKTLLSLVMYNQKMKHKKERHGLFTYLELYWNGFEDVHGLGVEPVLNLYWVYWLYKVVSLIYKSPCGIICQNTKHKTLEDNFLWPKFPYNLVITYFVVCHSALYTVYSIWFNHNVKELQIFYENTLVFW